MKPKIPLLVTMPEENDYKGIFGIATAYAHSCQILDDHADKMDRVDLFFPAVVCAAFSLELYLKFFVVLANSQDSQRTCKPHGHSIRNLWNKVSYSHQNAIVGMFRHNEPEPLYTGLEVRRRVFEEAFFSLGDEPFKSLRYLYEPDGKSVRPVSQAALWEVLKAVGDAAHFFMRSVQSQEMQRGSQ